MEHYSSAYDQDGLYPDSHIQQQQPPPMQSHTAVAPDGLNLVDPYVNSNFFAPPNTQYPPTFLDVQPRGPGIPLPFNEPPNLLPHGPSTQDSQWRSYADFSGQPSQSTAYPDPRAPSLQSSYPYHPQFPQQNAVPHPLHATNGFVSQADNQLAGLPPVPPLPASQVAPSMENISFQNGPPALIQPPNHVAAQNYSSHTAVIALPGQPPPFGPLFYSSSGFDMIGVLTRVASRKNPQVILGPVDFTCSFVVSDAQAPDEPIVYASPTFSELTGYDMNEIVGRNCRFLQSPTGRVRKGETRRYTDDKGVAHIRKSIDNVQECQVSFLNYKKNGEAFVNLVTIIPIPWDTDEIKYLIGFQVDLERQPGAILRMMGDGSYAVNYSSVADPFPPMSDKLKNVLGLNGTAEAARNKFNEFILDHSDDFIHVVSLKGAFQYVSPSVTAVLGYAPEDLAGKNIADIAHPADLVPVQRELKESTAQVQPPSLVSSSTLAQHYLSQAKLVHLLYRVKAKNGTFVWLEATGRLHVESSKGRKSIVFSGRVRRQPVLHWSSVVPDGVGLPPPGSLVHQPQNSMVDCWAHVGIDTGLLLYISSGGQTVLGRPPREMDGTALRDWVAPAWQITIDTALADARRKLEENQIIIESGSPVPSDATGTLTTVECRRSVPASRTSKNPAIIITFFSTYAPLEGAPGPVTPSSAASTPSTISNVQSHGSPHLALQNQNQPNQSPSQSPPLSPPTATAATPSGVLGPIMPPPPPPTARRRGSSASASSRNGRRQNLDYRPPHLLVRRGVRQPSIIAHIRLSPDEEPMTPRERNVQDYLRPHNMPTSVTPTPSPPISNGTPSDTPDSVMATANGNGVGSLDSASTVIPHTISTTYNGGESGETINAPRILSASLQANIFEELEIAKGSSWQYELQQLRMENGRLQKEIDDAIRQQRNGNGAVIEGASAGSISSSSSKSTVVPGPMPR